MKKAESLKPGDKIKVAGEVLTIVTVETSDIGKQGTKKCRIEAKRSTGDNVVIIRPADYPFEEA